MTIQVGDRIPDVNLTLATPEGPIPVKSGDYFAGKRVALFAVPGAYTPTCSARHLPSYVEKAAELKSKGVDEIVGTAVNDGVVEQLNVEAPGEYSASSAETMLGQL
jgi:peroxiredoxin